MLSCWKQLYEMIYPPKYIQITLCYFTDDDTYSVHIFYHMKALILLSSLLILAVMQIVTSNIPNSNLVIHCNVIPLQCPPRQHWNITKCACVCNPSGACLPNHYWNATLCSWICSPTGKCPNTKYWNVTQCTCACKPTRTCPKNYFWNVTQCACSCNPTGKCLTNYYWNRTKCSCKCAPITQCPTNNYWNATLCACLCNPTGTCYTYQYWNVTKCSCTCKIETCLSNQILDTINCMCQPKPCTITCPPRFNIDLLQCSCICLLYVLCTPGFHPDPNGCGVCLPDCIQSVNCTQGFQYDNRLCKCVPNLCLGIACPANFIMNQTSCLCFPSQSPSSP